MRRQGSPGRRSRAMLMIAGTLAMLAATSCQAEADSPPRAMADAEVFTEIDPGTYVIDPDGDPATPPRVLLTVPDEGWLSWTGAFKEQGDNGGRPVGVTVATPTHVVSDPCHQHDWQDPGPSVNDLAVALAALPGLELAAVPAAITAYGYQGIYLELIVPQLDYEPGVGFTDCLGGYLYAYRGQAEWGRALSRFYQGPGQILQVWILDVRGTRLLIEATRFPDSPPEDTEALQAVLDSIRIET